MCSSAFNLRLIGFGSFHCPCCMLLQIGIVAEAEAACCMPTLQSNRIVQKREKGRYEFGASLICSA